MPKRGIRIRDGVDRSTLTWGYPGAIGAWSGAYYPYALLVSQSSEYSPPDRTDWRPFVTHADMEVSGLSIEVLTLQVSGLLRLGLYAPNDNQYPDVLVEDLGTVDASTTGGKDAAFSANRIWTAGQVWWFAIQTNDTGIGVRGINENILGITQTGGGGDNVVTRGVTYSSGLPDPAGITNVRSGGFTPNILVKVA